ncbi:MAG TPA: PA14 domain-containing protein, partial [Verrucomicrobiota bacterium]|nr:PA14 domain-containing protein [Verrucomicrobiota bacterium]
PVLPPPGLVSWWPAEGNAQDIVGGNPGLNLDGVTFAAGVVGEAFYFDGANRRIVPGSLDFRGSGWTSYIRPGVLDNFTMEFWVFPTASRAATSQETSGWPGISGQRYAIAPQYGGTDGPAGVGVSVGINGISVFEHAGNYMPSPLVHAAPIPGWTHVAVVYENKQPSLYLNGAFIKTGLTSPRVSVFPSCQFGNVSSYGPFQGLLDEVSIYSRVLSAAEIQGIYGAGGAGKCKPPQPSEVIYAADFETNPGPEWSHTGISVTPRGGRHFLGRFGSQTVTLTVSNLPPHANLTATFDVFVIQSWDGNNGGPDIWEVGVAGGPMLLHTTFQNWGSLRQQAYPNNFPGGSYRGRIGALEAATLGYSDWDAVYRFSFTFPHASNVLQLSFRGANLEGVDDESWELDNLTVYADGPSIAFASPTNDAAFSTPTNLTLAVNALATGADLRCVQYFNNRVLLGTVTESPYTLVWSNAPAGHHIVTARVTDLAGKTAEAHCALRINGLMGEYFDNMNFMGTPARRLDPIVAFDWDGAIPIAGVSPTYFTARWTGEIEPLGSGPHTFYVTGDDRFRLWVDGVRIVDDWTDKSTSMRWGRSSLSSGRRYSIQLDYAQGAPSGA